MSRIEIHPGLTFPETKWNERIQQLFPKELLSLLIGLQEEFGPERESLLKARQERQIRYDQGELPTFLDRSSQAVMGTWRVAPIPKELLCRRVEITGPVNSAKMVINMLNRHENGARADMAMLDFEDSMKPTFTNVLDGYENVISAVKGELNFEAPVEEGSKGKIYRLNSQDMAYVMVRTRGLHLEETNIRLHNRPLTAGLLDLAVCFYHTAKIYLSKNLTPKYYIPKTEHFLEARWWNKVFIRLQESLGLPVGTLRATFLIETLPATFQVEEILYEVRDHAAGLNVGRWDKIFSDIKVLKKHPDRIMADRATITMERPWMENYAKRVIKICHERGAFAMGGMAAFTPGKTQIQREDQSRKVLYDKRREASLGHDGCWVSHPYFIGPAMEAFPSENQLHKLLDDFDRYADVLPQGGGPYSMQGLRTNIRVGIAYIHGWNQNLGCISFDHLMEDLATLEISRAQIWQWLYHGITLDDGTKVTRDLIVKLFDEEMNRIIQEEQVLGVTAREQDWIQAKDEACQIFLASDLKEFLEISSPEEI